MATITYPNLMEIDFGAIKALGKALERNGIKRPLICTDKGIVASGILALGNFANVDGNVHAGQLGGPQGEHFGCVDGLCC